MYTVLLVIHVMVVLALIGIILVQRPAGDGIGLSGSSSTSFISGRAAANFITRTTAVLAVMFILTSLGLGILITHGRAERSSIMDRLDHTPAPAAAPATPAQTPAKEPSKPSVPRPE